MNLLQIFDLLKKTNPFQLFRIKKFHNSATTYARHYMASYCLCSLFHIGFLDVLEKNMVVDMDVFLKGKNINREILNAICEYLFSLRIFNKTGNLYSLGPKGKDLLKYSKGTFDFIYAYAPLFENLVSLLCNEKKYNVDVFRRDYYVAKATAEVSQFIPIPIVKDIIKKYNFKTVWDIGCGSAAFLLQICGTSDLKGYGIDISEDAIRLAHESINKQALGQKVKVQAGDILNIGKYKRIFNNVDVVTCMFVLHEFLSKGEEVVIDLLKNIKDNFPGKYLIICELCKLSPILLRKHPTAIVEHHLFHALSQQSLLTIKEWRVIFRKAVYEIVEEKRYDFAGQVYFVIV